jgi:DNA-directed RNA polymerase III subunit RPC11
MVESGQREGMQFCCQNCPYIHPLGQGGKLTRSLKLRRKEVDDILGGADAWKDVDKTPTRCPQCKGPDKGKEAFFFMVQLRSADEPMTVFYKCVDCAVQWSE